MLSVYWFIQVIVADRANDLSVVYYCRQLHGYHGNQNNALGCSALRPGKLSASCTCYVTEGYSMYRGG